MPRSFKKAPNGLLAGRKFGKIEVASLVLLSLIGGYFIYLVSHAASDGRSAIDGWKVEYTASGPVQGNAEESNAVVTRSDGAKAIVDPAGSSHWTFDKSNNVPNGSYTVTASDTANYYVDGYTMCVGTFGNACNDPNNAFVNSYANIVHSHTTSSFSITGNNEAYIYWWFRPIPKIKLQISPNAVTTGQSYNVSWDATGGFTACTGSGDDSRWANKSLGISGSRNYSQGSAGTYKYGLTCTGTDVPVTSTTRHVDVSAPAAPPPPPPPPPPPSSPTVSLSANPTTVYMNNSLTISWSSSSASSCTASGQWGGAKALSGSENRSGDTSSVRTMTYNLDCQNSAGTHAAASATVNVIKSSPPTAPNGLGTDSPTSSSLHLHWNGSTAAAGSSIASYQVLNSSGVSIAATAAGTTGFTVTGLNSCASYSFSVVAVNNQGTASAPSNTAGGSTIGCAPSQQPTPAPPAPGQPHAPGSPAVILHPGRGGTVANNGAGGGGGSSPDTLPPTAPSNFSAAMSQDTLVQLSWDASSDDRGVTNYQIERSVDQQNWDSLTSNVDGTEFLDKTTAFNVHYFYRIKAVDAAGNTSDYANTDINTGSFNANTPAGDTTTIKTDDGYLSVVIPAGALDSDAVCTVALDDDNAGGLKATKQILVMGPYALVCKQSSGDLVDHFNQPVQVSLTIQADKTKHFDHFNFFAFDAPTIKWNLFKTLYDKKTKAYKFKMDKPAEFAVVGSNKKSYGGLVVTLLIILGIVAVVFVLIMRRRQRDQYDSYIRHKYYEL